MIPLSYRGCSSISLSQDDDELTGVDALLSNIEQGTEPIKSDPKMRIRHLVSFDVLLPFMSSRRSRRRKGRRGRSFVEEEEVVVVVTVEEEVVVVVEKEEEEEEQGEGYVCRQQFISLNILVHSAIFFSLFLSLLARHMESWPILASPSPAFRRIHCAGTIKRKRNFLFFN